MRHRRQVVAATACIVLYVLLDLLLRSVALPGSTIIPWYPSAGLAFAAIVLMGPIAAIPLFAARLLLVVLAGRNAGPFPVAFVEAAIQVLAYTAAGTWLRRNIVVGGRSWTLADAVRLSSALLGAALIAALISAFSLSMWRDQPWTHFWTNTIAFAAGDASGALVIVPLVLFVLTPTWRESLDETDDPSRPRGSGSPDDVAPLAFADSHRAPDLVLELLAFGSAIVLALSLRGHGNFTLAALSFVPLVWIALRNGVKGAAIMIAVYGLTGGLGAFFLGIPPERLLDYQGLLIIFGLGGLFVGAVRTSALESQARYWHLLATASEGVWRVDTEGRTST